MSEIWGFQVYRYEYEFGHAMNFRLGDRCWYLGNFVVSVFRVRRRNLLFFFRNLVTRLVTRRQNQGTSIFIDFMKFTTATAMIMGRDSSVGIKTRYGLDGPGIESRWGTRFFHSRPDRPWGPPSLLYNGYRGVPGVTLPGSGFDHPPQSSAEVNERVELYLYSPSGSSWPVLGWTLLTCTVMITAQTVDNTIFLCFVEHASQYNSVKINQLYSQIILSIFRQPLHVSGVSRPIIRRYNTMYTTVGTYCSF
jgi:hypothetical protein